MLYLNEYRISNLIFFIFIDYLTRLIYSLKFTAMNIKFEILYSFRYSIKKGAFQKAPFL